MLTILKKPLTRQDIYDKCCQDGEYKKDLLINYLKDNIDKKKFSQYINKSNLLSLLTPYNEEADLGAEGEFYSIDRRGAVCEKSSKILYYDTMCHPRVSIEEEVGDDWLVHGIDNLIKSQDSDIYGLLESSSEQDSNHKKVNNVEDIKLPSFECARVVTNLKGDELTKLKDKLVELGYKGVIETCNIHYKVSFVVFSKSKDLGFYDLKEPIHFIDDSPFLYKDKETFTKEEFENRHLGLHILSNSAHGLIIEAILGFKIGFKVVPNNIYYIDIQR